MHVTFDGVAMVGVKHCATSDRATAPVAAVLAGAPELAHAVRRLQVDVYCELADGKQIAPGAEGTLSVDHRDASGQRVQFTHEGMVLRSVLPSGRRGAKLARFTFIGATYSQ